jgi:hypothetical protein
MARREGHPNPGPPLAPGRPDDEGDPGDLVLVSIAVVEEAVVKVLLPVIRRDDEPGVLQETELAHGKVEQTHLIVGVSHLPVVQADDIGLLGLGRLEAHD